MTRHHESNDISQNHTLGSRHGRSIPNGRPFSEQTGDIAVGVHVDLLGGGDFRQARHGHHVAGDCYDKTRSI